MKTAWTSDALAAACAGDGEFRIAARFWTGGLRLEIGDALAAVTLTNGAVAAGDPGGDAAGVITLTAAAPLWDKLLSARPPRF